jgi:hypothetical protein
MGLRRLPWIYVLAAMLAFAGDPKLAPDLEKAAPASVVDVIVQFKEVPTQRHHDKVTNLGGRLKTDLSGGIRGAHYSIPAGMLSELAQDVDVAYISPDRELHGQLDSTTPQVR